jgi:beta-lactamase superfamily II metal-dependent hydrolase
MSYLDAFFARRTDLGGRLAAIFVTHTHIDHNASLDKIAAKYLVGGYIYNGVARGSGRVNARWMLAHARDTSPAVAFRAVSEGDVEAAGTAGLTDSVIDPIACPAIDPHIRVLAGGRELPDGTEFRPSDWGDEDMDNGNNHSLVIRVDFGKTSFLFPGDLEGAGISDLMSRYAGTTMLDADVLEVSHHGAANGTTAAFLAAVSPQIAVISMGPYTIQQKWTAWAYGHPRKVTTDLLYAAVTAKRSSKSVMVATKTKTFVSFSMDHAIYSTGWDGTIAVKADATGRVQVGTAR